MGRMNHVGRVLIILGATIFLGLGCTRSPSAPAPKPAGRKVEVLATVYPLADLARRIAGDSANVEWLCEAGQRPEAIEAGSHLKQRANRADLMLTSGSWDAWAVAEMSDQARTDRMVEPLRMPAARDADPKAYLWLDPPVVRQMAEAARTRLTIVDAARENEYRQNA